MCYESFQFFKNFDIKKMYHLMDFFKNAFCESYVSPKERYYKNLIFENELSKNMADKVLDHYLNHAVKHNLVVEDVCPYKIISWYSYLLAEHIYMANKTLAVKLISTAIGCMQTILVKEGINLDKKFALNVLRMTLLQISFSKKQSNAKSNNDRLGLGMNGFYMIFRTASICSKNIV